MLRDAQTVENGAKSSDAVLMNLERFLVLLSLIQLARRTLPCSMVLNPSVESYM